ncbi:MAG: CPBP family intramembrane metalloprotease [Spirochaetes bacterium]|jgi:membrane protease YdiL (CAAX protease family)|nr:CPBP family intramembrane metalloprotease [Spirochaetota bacterium]
MNTPNRVLFALGFEAAIGGIALLLAWILRIPLAPLLHIDPGDAAVAAIGVVLLGSVFFVVARSTWPPFRRIREQLDAILPRLLTGVSLGGVFLIAVVAGISEELLFRGVIQHGLDFHMATWIAVVAANIVFALAHLITPTYGVLALLMGGILSTVFIVTGSLVAAAITHALYDFAALTYYRSYLKQKEARP